MKGQESTLKELDKREASKLSDRDFRVMITKILNNMKKDIEMDP